MKKRLILSISLYFLALIDSFILNYRIQNASLSYLIAFIYYLITVALLCYYLMPFSENMNVLRSLKYRKYYDIKKIFVYAVVITTLVIKIILICKIKDLDYSFSVERLLACLSYAIGSIAEELLFRYTIYSKILKEKFPVIISVIITAILFALFHGLLNMAFFAYFAIGLIWTYLFELYPCLPLFMIYHFLWNVIQL